MANVKDMGLYYLQQSNTKNKIIKTIDTTLINNNEPDSEYVDTTPINNNEPDSQNIQDIDI